MENKELKMVGTGGVGNYYVIARIGDVGLGIKVEALMDASVLGFSGKTYLAFRLRSANWVTVLGGGDTLGNVVTMGDDLSKIWKNIKFEKVNNSRASTQVGVFIPTDLPGGLHGLVSHLESTSFLSGLTDNLVEMVGVENLTLTKVDLTDILRKLVASVISSVTASIKEGEAKAELMSKIDTAKSNFSGYVEDNIGVLDTFASTMKEIYEDTLGVTKAPTEAEEVVNVFDKACNVYDFPKPSN